MARIRTIFFDFGNVIAYFSHERTVERLVTHSKLGYEELYRVVYQHDRYDALETGRIRVDDYVQNVMKEGRLHCTEDYFRDVFADIFTPNPVVCDLIPALRGRHRLVLASNTNALHAGMFLRSLKPTFDHFHHLVLSHEARARKPHREFYEHCQQYADAEPGACLFVDDRPDNIATAQAHGWQTIHYTDHDARHTGLMQHGVLKEGEVRYEKSVVSL
jgi:putative hydrolase of the HAD superfamily